MANFHVTGTFEVKLEPMGEPSDFPGRMSINKTFEGALSATSHGQMLSHRTETPGSAGYVAMELVTGTLEGREGSFVLQHYGLMNRGEPSLIVSVVPDSGTGQLEGINGSMQIDITDGKHHYDFAYTLPSND